jgi:hypothetical protein
VKLSLTLDWTNKAAGGTPIIDMHALLQDYGPSGTTPGAVLLTADRLGVSTSVMNVATDDLYVGAHLRGRRDAGRGGSELVGDLSVLAAVPEPASLGVAAIGALTIAGRRRRS